MVWKDNDIWSLHPFFIIAVWQSWITNETAKKKRSMNSLNRAMIVLILIIAFLTLSACEGTKTQLTSGTEISGGGKTETHGSKPPSTEGSIRNTDGQGTTPSKPNNSDSIKTTAHADSVTVLVNKQYKLPEEFIPRELVYPDVRFTFREKIDKRKMRKEAAEKLEQLFAAADKAGMPLAGVSAYRSHKRQKELFESYVRRDGEKKALTYSAYPGTSEHETGLAIDVTGSDGRCAAASCFGGTPVAKWLDKHAHEYGFIIRYPKGKESITGYMYEPWHIRFVGQEAAKDIYKKAITLEEYMNATKVFSPASDPS